MKTKNFSVRRHCQPYKKVTKPTRWEKIFINIISDMC
jgi:hypothetical protein